MVSDDAALESIMFDSLRALCLPAFPDSSTSAWRQSATTLPHARAAACGTGQATFPRRLFGAPRQRSRQARDPGSPAPRQSMSASAGARHPRAPTTSARIPPRPMSSRPPALSHGLVVREPARCERARSRRRRGSARIHRIITSALPDAGVTSTSAAMLANREALQGARSRTVPEGGRPVREAADRLGVAVPTIRTSRA